MPGAVPGPPRHRTAGHPRLQQLLPLALPLRGQQPVAALLARRDRLDPVDEPGISLITFLEGVIIGVSSGLVLSGFAAMRAWRRRSKQIKMLRILCLWWIDEFRKEYTDGRFIVADLSKELERYLPIAASFLTADEVVGLSRGRSWLAGRAADEIAPAPEGSLAQADSYWQNVLAEFGKYVPFLKLRLERND